jgi:hypothetical protein
VSIVCGSRAKIENTGVSRLAFCFNLTAHGSYLYSACRDVFRKLVPCCMKSDLIPWYWYGRMIQIPSLGLASNPSQLTTEITRICHARATHTISVFPLSDCLLVIKIITACLVLLLKLILYIHSILERVMYIHTHIQYI